MKIGEKVVTMCVRCLDMKAAQLRQLPVSRGLTKDEQERFEPVCWVYGDSIDRREMRREPAVVGLLEGTPIVVFNVYGYTLDSARNVEFQVPGAMIRVPFALIG